MERGSDERVLLVALWLVLTCLGCATHRQVHLRSAIATSHVAREAGLTGQQKQQVANECFMGMPVKRAADPGSTEYVYRDGYVLEHSSLHKIPFWVCEHVRKDHLRRRLRAERRGRLRLVVVGAGHACARRPAPRPWFTAPCYGQ